MDFLTLQYILYSIVTQILTVLIVKKMKKKSLYRGTVLYLKSNTTYKLPILYKIKPSTRRPKPLLAPQVESLISKITLISVKIWFKSTYKINKWGPSLPKKHVLNLLLVLCKTKRTKF